MRAGLLITDTGSAASASPAFRAGVDARLGVVNAAGGVNGRTTVYSWSDDGSDPGLNRTGASQLVEVQHVFGIIEGSTVGSGSAAYLDAAGVPVVGVGWDSSWDLHPNMFAPSYYLANGPSVSTWGDYVHSQGGTRAAILDLPFSDASRNLHRQLADSLQAAGIGIGFTAEVTPDATDFASLASHMKAAHVDVITGGLLPAILAKVLPATRAAGIAPKAVVAPTGYDPTLLRQLGPQLAGTTIYLDFVPFELNTPAHRELLAAMGRYAPQVQPPNQQSAVNGWLAADLFIRGLQAAGSCPTRAALISGLRSVHNYDGGGLLPRPIDLGTNRGQLNTCFDFVRVADDGRSFVPLQPIVRCGTRLG